jgi:hypothetical protein
MPLLTESELVNTIDTEKLEVENVRRILFILNKFLQEYDPYPKLFDALQKVIINNVDTKSMNKLRSNFKRNGIFK